MNTVISTVSGHDPHIVSVCHTIFNQQVINGPGLQIDHKESFNKQRAKQDLCGHYLRTTYILSNLVLSAASDISIT